MVWVLLRDARGMRPKLAKGKGQESESRAKIHRIDPKTKRSKDPFLPENDFSTKY